METTPVEWLVANIDWQLLRTTKTHKAHYNMIVEQAKEMEKQQIIESYIHDRLILKITAEEYYNKTFKSE